MKFEQTYAHIEAAGMGGWLKTLPGKVDAAFDRSRWGDLPRWQKAVNELPELSPSEIDLDQPAVRVGSEADVDDDTRSRMMGLLKTGLHPWRKGPFDFFGIPIETEWRSDLKWDRLKGHIQPLVNRTVLDVGCGNGYFGWRMKGAGARLVCGIDSTILYPLQFQVFQKYIQDDSVAVFPLDIDDMPEELLFDTVFSMGVLYHRRSPLDHLLQLKNWMREGGELILETLVIDGGKDTVLTPKDRYAMMPNVWLIPSVAALEAWLKKTGFKNIRCIDVTKTTPDEQRGTDWMNFQSLQHFLDSKDPQKTVEGYPAPQRAILLAEK